MTNPGIRRVLSAAAVAGAAVAAGTAAPLAAQYPTEPPAAAPLSPVRFPPFREATLSNGLQIVLVENHELPVVSVSLSIPVGAVNDPAGQEGLAGMVAELLTKGTETRSAEELAATIEGVGGTLSASAGEDFFSLNTTVLTDHVDLAFELIRDVLLHSTYPAEELELARRRTLSALRLEKSDPDALAARYFARALYGEHPYARAETEASVQAITREGVVQWAQRHLRPRDAMLVVAGDLGLDRVRALATRAFDGWTGAPPARPYTAAPAPSPTTILLIHRPGSEQSNIMVGNLALRPGDATYFPAVVANKYLGGGTDARLFQILREEKGWTYGSYSGLVRRRDIGYFRATAEVRTEVTDSALGELLAQLRRVRREPPASSELEAAKSFITGSFPLQIETPQQVASQVSLQKRLGLPDDYLTTYRSKIAAVGPREARRAAQEVIRPDSAVIVVVGDGTAIYEKLTAFAPVRIVDTEGNPLTAEDLEPPSVALTFDPDQVVSRRDSFTVIVQGNPMGGYILDAMRGADSVIYTESLAIPAVGMQQQGRVVMAGDFTLRSVHQLIRAGGTPLEGTLRFTDGRIRGTAVQPPAGPGAQAQVVEVDTTVATGVLETNQVQILIPTLPLEPGKSFTVNAYDASQNRVRTMTIRVEAVEEVTVPAGTFSAFRVAVTGGDTPTTVWITREAPRRMVKLELVGTPITMELVR